MILDIRTLSINNDKKQRDKSDSKLKETCKYFDFITLISEGISQKLQLNNKKTAILPLGSDIISNKFKSFDKINLLYVGTLNGRNIKDTVKGFKLFCDKNPYFLNITYDIVGDGSEYEEIKALVRKLNLEHVITVHGRIPHFELKPFFDKCNVGVSYVPITEYYEHQPVTKTYEYILSGMICIATSTQENKFAINNNNGILCKDTPESFANALEAFVKNRKKYNSSKIQSTLENHTWEKIVCEKLLLKLNDF